MRLAAALLGAAVLLSVAAPGAGGEGLPPVPEIEVKPRPLHSLQEDPAPAAARSLDVRRAPTPEPAPRPAVAAPPARPGGAAPSPPGTARLAGAAKPAGAAALRIDGTVVHLFGVRPPAPRDACAGVRCADRAKALLGERLKRSRRVTCHVPARPGAAVCRDASDVDLGGLLVSEGLARADTAQSYDYLNAENSARAARRGLWQRR